MYVCKRVYVGIYIAYIHHCFAFFIFIVYIGICTEIMYSCTIPCMASAAASTARLTSYMQKSKEFCANHAVAIYHDSLCK